MNYNAENINWKYNIGDCLKGKYADLIITNREIRIKDSRRRKYYKCSCNICSWSDGWYSECDISRKNFKCSCCSGYKVVKGINDVATTNQELLKFFYNIEDAYTTTSGSRQIILFKCPYCGYKKEYEMSQLKHYGFSCPNCSDKISYGEKFMSELLNQLKIKYKHQLTSKDFQWCNSYRYDFYFDNTIVEIMGLQHYLKRRSKKTFFRCYDEEHDNDIRKKELAINNGIKNYVDINASESSISFLKNSILNSSLPNILNFTEKDIDWEKCDQVATSSRIYDVCAYANSNKNLSIPEIASNLNYSYSYVYTCIKKEIKDNTFGFNLECILKNGKKACISHRIKKVSTPVLCVESGNVYMNSRVCEEHMSNENTIYHSGNIRVAAKNCTSYKNLHFIYIGREEFNSIKKEHPEKAFGEFFLCEEESA